MTSMKKTKLFLHMGPGFHCRIEEKIYGASFPGTYFWSQPAVKTFTELKAAARLELAQLESPKVDLLAHSFGSQLALDLVQHFPEKIGKIYILNGAVDPFECFLNMGASLGLVQPANLIGYQNLDTPGKIEFIFKVATDPKFPQLYWFSIEKMKAWETQFSGQPPLNIETFASVFADYLNGRDEFIKNLKPWSGDVAVVYSENDVLLKFNKDVQPWSHFFPVAKFKKVQNVGHYAHLEDQEMGKDFFLS